LAVLCIAVLGVFTQAAVGEKVRQGFYGYRVYKHSQDFCYYDLTFLPTLS